MSQGKKGDDLGVIRKRYKKSNRVQKGVILDEFCANRGYARKYAIRLLRKTEGQRKVLQKRGRRPRYEVEKILVPLRAIWLASDQLCSKRLKSALKDWLLFYEQEHGALEKDIREQLLYISPSTLDRLLKPIRVRYPHKGLSGTKPGRLLKNQIPIKTDHWDVTCPGYLEADTVAHCGNSLSGDFVWSLTLTDIDSTWTENRATWNKGSSGVIEQIKSIEKGLPFEILGFDCDNVLTLKSSFN